MAKRGGYRHLGGGSMRLLVELYGDCCVGVADTKAARCLGENVVFRLVEF